MNRFFAIVLLVVSCVNIQAQSFDTQPTPYSWRLEPTIGTRYIVPMDTLQQGFYLSSTPSAYDIAYGYTGNIGAPGFSKIYFNREEPLKFFFLEPFRHGFYHPSNYTFYNTRIPYSQVTYLAGGGQQNEQQILSATFSGNVNKQLAIGGAIDYLLGRGSYSNQASKATDYRLFGSYIGERYQLQAAVSGVDKTVKENGGITNDDYILDPESMQIGIGGSSTQNIPVNLSNAFSHVKNTTAYATQRYNIGFYREEIIPDSLRQPYDTLGVTSTFIPVTSLFHTATFTNNDHRFISQADSDNDFFKNTYYGVADGVGTNDSTSMWSIQNTVGIELKEGFHKYAKMGVAAYLTHEYRNYHFMGDTIRNAVGELISDSITHPYTEHEVWVGGTITKRMGSLLTYDINAQLGLLGASLGDIVVNGRLNSELPLWGDTLVLEGYGLFRNTTPSYLYNHYTSSHFIWNNDFEKSRRLRFGGALTLPQWGTKVDVGTETVQNHIYMDSLALPIQHSDMIQLFSASLSQNLQVGILNFNNSIVYQTSSNSAVIPLPELSIRSNLYLDFHIAKVLHTQIGVDCLYNTAYYAQAYQPATLSFHNQEQVKVGGYPLMNLYANMKLNEIRFFVMLSHANQGLVGGYNSFSLPHYPLPPRMFQFGVSVDFSN